MMLFIFAFVFWIDFSMSLWKYGSFIFMSPFIAFVALMLSIDENK